MNKPPGEAKAETTVRAGDAGERLDRFLASKFSELSRTRLKRLILDGKVRIGGRTIGDPGYRVKPAERIELSVPPPEPAKPGAEKIPLEIVFEDRDLIVIDKPAGLVVHPAAGNRTGTLVNALIAHCGESLSGIGGEKRPGIVHRLDKDTSGLLVVAKTDRAHRGLAAQFADHGKSGPLQRGYLALVWGVPEPREGTIDQPIGRDPRARVKMAVRAGGRRAVTHYKVRRIFYDAKKRPLASLVECRLETGRTHQIRVHLAKIGHPLLGDDTYGAGFRSRAAKLSTKTRRALIEFNRQALHAYLLGFAHPASGKPVKFEQNPPPGFAFLLSTFTSK
ncbi:MAG TPA: RluA family pseudouridine synthase [Xanthobacteraceae bacterium]|nr:RluA family pseudouridine synthase [Xanthobacteraceae bacterium]